MSNYYRPGGAGGFSFLPPVIKNLLIINAAVFVIQFLGARILIESAGMRFDQVITKYFALIPISGIHFTNVDPWVFLPWQLITYQFMHGDFSHIFFNMFTLWMFGMELENNWGSKKFLFFYLLCGTVAGLAHLFITPLLTNDLAPTIGASGAIFGVMVAFAMMFPDRYIYIYFLIPVKAKYLIAFMVVLEFLFVNSSQGGNIAHLAHLGGAVAGLIYVLIDRNRGIKYGNIFRRNTSKSQDTYNPYVHTNTTSSDINEAKYYDINSKEEDKVDQAEIDKILDKISQSGYQKLTAREKQILFEASKKMNRK